jgi:ParB family transcriptional regulator, chromosome partitioning protein
MEAGPRRRQRERVDIDLHRLELRYDDLRIRDAARRRRLIASVAEIGQQVPVVVIAEGDRLVLIDGYLRVEALRRLHRDTAAATAWPLSEPEALLQHRHLTAASRHTALEDAWLLARLRTHGLSFEDLARRLCRSKSWVSRRLALLDGIATAAQAAVRAGIVPPHAAMKYLLPLARANRGHCEQLIAGLGATAVSVREVGALYQAWRRANAAGRAQLVAHPLLFLRAFAAATRDPGVDDSDVALVKDLTAITGVAWRARRRVHQGSGLTAAQINAWRPASDAFCALRAAIEEKHAGPIDPNHHPGAP